ncbi:hypothetical protein AB4150_13185 [Vibrio cyclitrophicus]
MKTKLLSPNHKLSFDDQLVELVESYDSNEHLQEYKVAVIGTEGTHYRNITVYGNDALEDLNEELDSWDMINRLAYLPPAGAYHAVYSEREDDDVL